MTANCSPSNNQEHIDTQIRLIPDLLKQNSSKNSVSQSCTLFLILVRNSKVKNLGIQKKIVGINKSTEHPKQKKQINTTVNSPKEILSPTINNYVNITTITGNSAPYKIQNTCFLSPQNHDTKEIGKNTLDTQKKTLVVKQNLKKSIPISKEIKALLKRKKLLLGIKSENHSKKQSLNSSIDKLFKNKRGSLGNPPTEKLKITKQQEKIVVTKYAFYSKVGKIPDTNKPNQDSFIVHPKIMGSYSHHLFGVADGHGQYGKEVSTVVKQSYPKLFEENLKSQSIPKAFEITSFQVNDLIEKEVEDIEFSGTTCVMVYINDQELYTANIGDSRAIFGIIENGKSNNSL